MINQKSVLGIIPARGGSKGLPGKNMLELGGEPLISWTIAAGKKSGFIDRLILSSDDRKIIDIARSRGCEVPFTRPSDLAQDDTPGIEVVLHAIGEFEQQYDYVVLLQPTSPFRSVEDIDGCVKLCIEKDAPACVSMVEVSENPYWMYVKAENDRIEPLFEKKEEFYQRQRLPEIFILNGAVYVAKTGYLKKRKSFLTEDTVCFLMPSTRSLDIDTEMDFRYAEFLAGCRTTR